MRTSMIPALPRESRLTAGDEAAPLSAARDPPGFVPGRRLPWKNGISMRMSLLPGVAGYGVMATPIGGGGALPCLWRLWFGLTCPGCGLSRANALLVRGLVNDAIAMNVLVVPLWLIALWSFAAASLTFTREAHHG
jgi:hypothetical protein